MKFILIILIFAGFTENTVELNREATRKMYFEGWQGECGAEALVDSFREIGPVVDPVLLAYKGAATATLANCKVNHIRKLTVFNEGKKLIEKAVSNDPENPEIRFIRFTVQSNIPSLLRYDNPEVDKKFIMDKLILQPGQIDNYIRKQMVIYFEKHGDLSVEEQKQLVELKAKR